MGTSGQEFNVDGRLLLSTALLSCQVALVNVNLSRARFCCAEKVILRCEALVTAACKGGSEQSVPCNVLEVCP
jgi:hypothetical protein